MVPGGKAESVPMLRSREPEIMTARMAPPEPVTVMSAGSPGAEQVEKVELSINTEVAPEVVSTKRHPPPPFAVEEEMTEFLTMIFASARPSERTATPPPRRSAYAPEMITLSRRRRSGSVARMAPPNPLLGVRMVAVVDMRAATEEIRTFRRVREDPAWARKAPPPREPGMENAFSMVMSETTRIRSGPAEKRTWPSRGEAIWEASLQRRMVFPRPAPWMWRSIDGWR